MKRIEKNNFAIPKVGQGATVSYFSDRVAGTVISVSKTGHKIIVQEDDAIRVDKNGMSESQEYRFEKNEKGRTYLCFRKKNGRYNSSGLLVSVGKRSRYYDYSF